jgi:hypothetical protein
MDLRECTLFGQERHHWEIARADSLLALIGKQSDK